MFLEAIALAFLIAFLRGGRLKTDYELRAMWLAPVAFVLQVLNNIVVPESFQVVVTVVSYGLLLYFAWLNLNNQGIRLILVGMVLNMLVITANGGRIPVDLDAARAIGVDVSELAVGTMAKHEALHEGSKLKFLADVVPVPVPIARVISVGDIFAVIGAFLLIQDLMGKPISIVRSEESRS